MKYKNHTIERVDKYNIVLRTSRKSTNKKTGEPVTVTDTSYYGNFSRALKALIEKEVEVAADINELRSIFDELKQIKERIV